MRKLNKLLIKYDKISTESLTKSFCNILKSIFLILQMHILHFRLLVFRILQCRPNFVKLLRTLFVTKEQIYDLPAACHRKYEIYKMTQQNSEHLLSNLG